jgi:hypothetical protein
VLPDDKDFIREIFINDTFFKRKRAIFVHYQSVLPRVENLRFYYQPAEETKDHFHFPSNTRAVFLSQDSKDMLGVP